MMLSNVFREAAEEAERQDAKGTIYVSAIACIWQSQERKQYNACVACEKLFSNWYNGMVAENNTQAILMLGFLAEVYKDGEGF